MSQQPSTLVLRNGQELPRVGLGTYKASGEPLAHAVTSALRSGMRHIDTASIYKNSAPIASGLAAGNVPRSELFITSKVSAYEQGTDKARAACQAMLEGLQTPYLDLVLVHWPGASKVAVTSPENARLRLQTWRVMEEFHARGLFRSIGVSNYEEHHIRHLMEAAATPPAVNQMEVHPRRQNRQLRAACAEAGVAVVAYASMGCGELLCHPVVMAVAKECGKTPAQVLLRWGLEEGCAVIPKSVNLQHLQQFTPDALLSWQLEARHKAALDALEDDHKFCWDPKDVA
ncbi:MAG: hypothetical protein WDW36_004661 [Sanguina aurantia]